MMITKKATLWIKGLSKQEHINKDLLYVALTHDSVSQKAGGKGKSNERLEFLGDRVLGLVIAQALYKLYPNEKEGLLARRLAWLASRETLNQVAYDIKIYEHIMMSFSEEKSGGRQNPTILSDAVEALIAYLYLEYGFNNCYHFIETYWHRFLKSEEAPKDAKSSLQEWAQKNKFGLPIYEQIKHTGPDHAPEFVIEVTAGKHKAKAKAKSKKKAERLAAENLLMKVKQ